MVSPVQIAIIEANVFVSRYFDKSIEYVWSEAIYDSDRGSMDDFISAYVSSWAKINNKLNRGIEYIVMVKSELLKIGALALVRADSNGKFYS